MTGLVRPLDDDWMAHRLDTSMPKTPPQQLKFSMTQWLRTIGWQDDTSKDSCSDSMTPWLEDDQLNALRPKVSALAQGLDGAAQKTPHWLEQLIMQWVEVTNDEMTEKATMQIGR